MSDYDNSNSGALFKNKNMRADKKDPEYRGNAEVVCAHCGGTTAAWIDSWLNTAKQSGEKFMSLRFRAKDQQPAPPAEAPAVAVPAQQGVPFDDQIPF